MSDSPKMLPRDEFVRYWRLRAKSETITHGLWFAAVYIGGMGLFAVPMLLLGEDYINSHLWPNLVFYLTFFCYLIAMPIGWMRITSGPIRKEFHGCPACRYPIRGGSRLVVCATNRCGNCGETILSE
jgi:hypothetical protein